MALWLLLAASYGAGLDDGARLSLSRAAHAHGWQPNVDEGHKAATPPLVARTGGPVAQAPQSCGLGRAGCRRDGRQVPFLAGPAGARPVQEVGVGRQLYAC